MHKELSQNYINMQFVLRPFGAETYLASTLNVLSANKPVKPNGVQGLVWHG